MIVVFTERNFVMNLDFSILNFSEQLESKDMVMRSYQYWIILSGSAVIEQEDNRFVLVSHDLLEIPPELSFSITSTEPLSIGCIELTDFFITNKKLKHVSYQNTAFVCKVFFFALDTQGMHIAHASKAKEIINQLMFEALMSMNLRKPQMSAAIFNFIEDVNEHYLDSDYQISKSIKQSGYSDSHFRKLFQNEVGTSPLHFLNNHRLEHAKKLMHEKKEKTSIKEIALSSGFTDAYYFSRLFKQNEHMTPTEYLIKTQEE
ncbi:MAG: helix-turn-helix transcriptional regulator [Hespellia sp.]|nr:helix-turn-helix transcriptional regulator [Hespellia sp.]